MAAPTQAYPPWLSPEPVTMTQDGTVVVQTTVIQFPQTYYGPSIPLGPGWVFGGSTFPASIATSFAASSTPSISAVSSLPSQTIATSASTTATSLSASTTATSVSASTAGSLTTASSSSSSSSTSGPSSPNTSHGVSSGTQLIIILSTILGTVLLGILVLVLCRIHLHKRRRRVLLGEGNFSDWSFVPPIPQQHIEGRPEESERAVLLTGERRMRERRAGPAVFPAWPTSPPEPPQVGRPTTSAVRAVTASVGSASKADSSTLDSAEKREDLARFNASGSGSLFFNPGREGGRPRTSDATEEDAALAAGVAAAMGYTDDYSVRPSGAGPPQVPPRSSARPTRASTPTSPSALYLHPSAPSSQRDGDRLYRNDVHRFGALRARESQEEDAEEQLLPPRRIDPDRLSRSEHSRGSRDSWAYPDSPQSETDERATLLTARRVNIGPASQPVLASSPPERRKSLEGWVTPPDEQDPQPTKPPPSPGSWSVGLGGLTGLAKGLGRLSWFKRMDNQPGPSGTHHSSPNPSHRGRGSRPASGVSFVLPASRPHSGLFHPPFASTPTSAVSYRLVDTELGIRPPGIRDPGTASGSGGSGSGKSGATTYHSVSSLPRTSFYVSGSEHAHPEEVLAHTVATEPALPQDFDLGDAGDTIRSVDVLDLPVPERALPFSAPVLPEPSSSRSRRPDTASSRGTGLPFPPGLVTVQKWDKSSHSSSSNRGGGRDVLEDEPPQAGGEWSSLRSKGSASDLKQEGEENIGGRRGLVTSSSMGEQAVRVVVGEPTASETASISSAPRHPADPGHFATATSPRSPTGLFVLTPRVSMYAASQSDLFSHSGSGSHSSRPSQHTTLHSQEASQPSSSNHENDHGNPPPPPDSAFHRASLTAMGDQRPPQLPPLRPLSHMRPMMEQPSEDRETEEESGTATISRPGTAVSQPTMSEGTNTGTFSSGTTSTGAHTTVVPSSMGSPGKR